MATWARISSLGFSPWPKTPRPRRSHVSMSYQSISIGAASPFFSFALSSTCQCGVPSSPMSSGSPTGDAVAYAHGHVATVSGATSVPLSPMRSPRARRWW